MCLLSVKYIYCSLACAINLGSSVILTGGPWHSPTTRVTQYNEAGFIKDLPPLQKGRTEHGCTSYDNNEGTKVNIAINYNCPIILFQTYLVSGGYDGSAGNFGLSSTELLVETSLAWVFTGELPSPRWGLRGANIDKKILMTGNF